MIDIVEKVQWIMNWCCRIAVLVEQKTKIVVAYLYFLLHAWIVDGKFSVIP